MKAMWQIPFLYLLLCCATQTLCITIVTHPVASTDGLINVNVNGVVSLVCTHETSSETEDDEIVWLRNGAAVKLEEGNKNGKSSVCITPVITDDNDATFKCYLRENSSFAHSVTLNVLYPPELSGSEDVTVEEKEDLVLRCDILANPPVTFMNWTLNGTTVDLVDSGITLSRDGYISQLKASFVKDSMHKGTYKCTASRGTEEYSKTFHVTVTESTMKFPLYPIIAAAVVVCLTLVLAFVSRWQKIVQCCK